MTNNILIIFAKHPVHKEVKTRIGKVKGHDTAVKIYKKLIKHTNSIISNLDVQIYIYLDKEPLSSELWNSNQFEFRLQSPGNLGQKMEDAFSQCISEKERVIIIGSDCADLNEKDLETAFQLLDNHDVVIGPAEDGGYYLLGTKGLHLGLFRNMPWSKDGLFKKTIQAIENEKLSYAELPVKSDIDYWEDWQKLGWSID